jgi:hypothetical protein
VIRPRETRWGWGWRGTALAVAALGLAAAAWWLGARQAAPHYGEARVLLARTEAELARTSRELEAARREIATLSRSQQVSDSAGASLGDMLRDREEEIAQLRADLEFYRRLVGGQGTRQGLAVHEFELQRIEDSNGYAFELTLLQNVKRGTVTEGTVEITVEGVDGQRQMRRLGWSELRQNAAAQPLQFSLKYFQRLDGILAIPNDVTPERIVVVVKSAGGEQARQQFDWSQVLASSAAPAASGRAATDPLRPG